jgi:antitoxin ParD1/3/4
MNVSLTPELERLVHERVESGLYNNASEVIREALRETFRRQQERDQFVREAVVGYAQLQVGKTVRVKSKKGFESIVRGQE